MKCIVLCVLCIFIYISYAESHEKISEEKEKGKRSTYGYCNPSTGYKRSKCSSKVKMVTTYYKACGWLWRKRCKTGSKYWWKTTYHSCNVKCTVNGGWSSWGPWRTSGACSKTCGQGLILTTRERTCSNPRPRCYGKHCPGSSKVSFFKKCFVKHCIVNGGWGSWQTWSNYGTCSKTCGSGKKERHRERYCNNPVPKYGGAACHGRSKEKESAICNVQHCKVNGKWSGWGNWGHFRHCSETCGHGVRYRYRYRECNNPEPEHGGKKCPGSLRDEEFKRFFLRKCPKLQKTNKISKIRIGQQQAQKELNLTSDVELKKTNSSSGLTEKGKGVELPTNNTSIDTGS